MAADQNLYIWFIDVGQGDGTFIRFPPDKHGKIITMLIDLGSTKGKAIRGNVFQTFDIIRKLGPDVFPVNSRYYEKKTIDYLVISHADQDHYNLLNALMKSPFGYSFDTVYFSGDPTDYKVGNFSNYLFDKIKRQEAIKVGLGWQANWPDLGGAQIHTLSAGYSEERRQGVSTKANTTSTNTSSIVLQIEYKGSRVMLPADATILTEAKIISDYEAAKQLDALKSGFAKVAHHGSARSSTSSNWAQLVSPLAIFISADRTGKHEGAGGCSTGHRLPQQLAIDTMIHYGGRIQKNPQKLSYVSYYEEKNFAGEVRTLDGFGGYGKSGLKNQTINNPETFPTDVLNRYYEVLTEQAIYSNLVKLDYKKNTQDIPYDFGVTNVLIITPQHDIVKVWDGGELVSAKGFSKYEMGIKPYPIRVPDDGKHKASIDYQAQNLKQVKVED